MIYLFFLSSFNKRIEDFKGDLKAYNDYLEDVEEMSKFFNFLFEVSDHL